MMINEKKNLKTISTSIENRSAFHIQIPQIGKMVFNKIVPYFFLYRIANKNKQKTMSDLAKSQLSYVVIEYETPEIDYWLARLVYKIQDEFGSCLVIEIWESYDNHKNDISIHVGQKVALPIAEYIKKNLHFEAPDLKSNLLKQQNTPTTPGYNAILPLKRLHNHNIFIIGISITSKFKDENGELYPILERHFRETLSKTISRTFFEFIRLYTNINPSTFKLNIHKEITSTIFEIDKALLTESQRFDFLLLVTPLNVTEAWETFKKNRYSKIPSFQYRPMPIDPDIIKRNLYNLPIENIHDPNIAYLFRDKRRELDEMMSMLDDRNTEDFVHGSLQIFGNVSDKLLHTAEALITVIDDSYDHSETTESVQTIDANEFAVLAKQEIQYLKNQYKDLNTTVRIREDIAGIMVNRGVLNINQNYRVPQNRVHALLQHEVGTHIATYFNGKIQSLKLFSLGVPGYEKLQEGLAVFAEYMMDGLTNQRLKTLAARVIAVRSMLMGNSFIDTFSLLIDKYNFSEYNSYTITMRIYRGGGLTKDALYLEGLIELLEYIRQGNDLKILSIGKIRKDYIPIIKDLIQRGYLSTPRVIPRYLSDDYNEKLNKIRKHGSIFQMIK